MRGQCLIDIYFFFLLWISSLTWLGLELSLSWDFELQLLLTRAEPIDVEELVLVEHLRYDLMFLSELRFGGGAVWLGVRLGNCNLLLNFFVASRVRKKVGIDCACAWNSVASMICLGCVTRCCQVGCWKR